MRGGLSDHVRVVALACTVCKSPGALAGSVKAQPALTTENWLCRGSLADSVPKGPNCRTDRKWTPVPWDRELAQVSPGSLYCHCNAIAMVKHHSLMYIINTRELNPHLNCSQAYIVCEKDPQHWQKACTIVWYFKHFKSYVEWACFPQNIKFDNLMGLTGPIICLNWFEKRIGSHNHI